MNELTPSDAWYALMRKLGREPEVAPLSPDEVWLEYAASRDERLSEEGASRMLSSLMDRASDEGHGMDSSTRTGEGVAPQHSADLELVRGVLEDRSEATALLVDRMHCVPLIVLARNARLGSPFDEHDLEHLAQEALAVAWLRLSSFSGRTSLETWVAGICQNLIKNALRRKRQSPAQKHLCAGIGNEEISRLRQPETSSHRPHEATGELEARSPRGRGWTASEVRMLKRYLGATSSTVIARLLAREHGDVKEKILELGREHARARRAGEESATGSLSPNRPGASGHQSVGTQNRLYSLLLEARTAERVTLYFKDGRVLNGALIFNQFKQEGRLINLDQELSIDFTLDDLRDLELHSRPGPRG